MTEETAEMVDNGKETRGKAQGRGSAGARRQPTTHEGGLIASLVAAMAEIEPVFKTKTVQAGRVTYSYATLADVLSAVRPALARHGLVVLQNVVMEQTGPSVTTTIVHASGEKLYFGPLVMPCDPNNAQSIGSAITYGRRYSLMAALGIAAEDEDDDGASAVAGQPARPAQQPAPQQPQRGGAEHVLQARAQKVMSRISALGDAPKRELQRWLGQQSKPLSASGLASDGAWLAAVEAKVTELEQRGVPVNGGERRGGDPKRVVESIREALPGAEIVDQLPGDWGE